MLPDVQTLIDMALPYAPYVVGGALMYVSAKGLMPRDDVKNGWLTVEGARRYGLTDGTVPLGRMGREVITAPKESFILAIGPTGSGKTKNLIENIIFSDAPNSQVIFDLKGDLLKATAHARSKVGPVYVLDPSGGPTNHYNPYVDIPRGDIATIKDFHSWLVPQQDAHSFYAPIAIELFYAAATHVLHTCGNEKHMPAMHALLSTEGWHDTLKNSPVPEVRYVASGLSGNVRKEITGSVLNLLNWLTYPSVRKIMSKSDFRLSGLQSEKDPFTIYIRLPEQSRKTMMPFARAIIGMLTITMMNSESKAVDGADKVRGITIIIDEVKQLALPNIETFLSAGRSFGGRIVLASQLLSEIRDLYGLNIEGNCTTQLFTRLQLLKDAEHVSEAFGTRKVFKRNVTRSHGRYGSSESVRIDEKDEPLLTPTDVMQLPKHTHLVGIVDGRPLKLNTMYAPKEFADVRGKPFTVATYAEVPNPWEEAAVPPETPSLLQTSAAERAPSSPRRPRATPRMAKV